MCHPSADLFVRQTLSKLEFRSRVLEIGAEGGPDWSQYLIKGHDHYTGVDRRHGPRVDWVMDFENIEVPPATPESCFDLILCTEVLEHALRPWMVIANMAAYLAPGGDLIVTARGYDELGCAPVHGKAEHGDYWRFSPEAIELMFVENGLDIVELRADTDPLWRGVLVHARMT
jgi:SAM-dependent methyltransferase